ncbi:MAG: class I SAM-dependent RNA methyltransferase [Anaerovoracaceae bacterium]|nr:class I SAM-dependent RNA methyltransferase [Anaerovoracaceae bacterium]
MKRELTATAAFGLEAVVRREVQALGYDVIKTEDGKVTFAGDERAIAAANIRLRTADRVFLHIAEFGAEEFEELYQMTRGIAWEEIIPMDGKFDVIGSSVKSTLHSVPACQSIVKKAVADRLGSFYSMERMPETGAEYKIKISMLKDRAALAVDTTGPALHKRGYRVAPTTAPLKETLASALVQLSFWNPDRYLVDPTCGSGTIAIEAAMIGRNIAPGLTRRFVSENWDIIDPRIWKEERAKAYGDIDTERRLHIEASDIDADAVAASMRNAAEAGVGDCIDFSVRDIRDFHTDEKYGIMIMNPPYGARIGDRVAIENIYGALREFFAGHPDWSLFMITADRDAEKETLGRRADRRRKLFNGNIETTYYQFHGQKPVYE